ncbi:MULTISPECIES: hypothetical protein [Stenotrophomonas]|uniref:hypothetical protein n=1 Tax=Stenotrophomonas TaxID=40323 RepID=UPI00018FF291|nr:MULTISPECIES: hypothetical protein [Stenotrophomonas]EED38519.1 protease [Stenotrophomonas sp. SKA14]MBA0233885.1 hypothetical protein [Stenotrophomonas maltophilia]MBA0267825.1 hypothetical protein [Stenotrophomonas maltophilia]MDZ7475007.1 hypothetical protein [Stenotrophomonas pavanii]
MALRAFQIFRAGTWNSQSGPITVDKRAVSAVAINYSQALKSAPLVIGHPDDESNTFGQVRGLADMDGELYAFADVADGLISSVRSGNYKNVSASIYFPNTPGNPMPGSYYLRHVGFLGAQAPAVKGMQPLSFAEPAHGGTPAAANFSIPVGAQVDRTQMQLYELARDVQHANPSIGFIQAAIMAQRAIQR